MILHSFAGSDSTSSTTQAFFYHLFTNSRVLHKVLEELDAARQSGVFSTEIADYSETQHLKYFQAALKESMRLKPAFASDISRVVPKEGVNIHGYSFPGGTRLALNATVLHRDKGVFGPDADMYRPERWLEDEERARRMNRHMYQVRTDPSSQITQGDLTNPP
jgi:cytochrome P450